MDLTIRDDVGYKGHIEIVRYKISSPSPHYYKKVNQILKIVFNSSKYNICIQSILYIQCI